MSRTRQSPLANGNQPIVLGSNAAERQFIRQARLHGWKCLRAGWPDFMLVKKNEKGGVEFRAVEVKRAHKDDPLRDAQKLMLAALAVQGIDCFIWSAETKALRKIERIDAQKVIDDYFNKTDARSVTEALRQLRAEGVLVRYDI